VRLLLSSTKGIALGRKCSSKNPVLGVPTGEWEARFIDASPCGDMTFLVNEFGRPFYGRGIRQLVPGPLRRSGRARPCSWFEEGGRDDSGGQRRDDAPTHGYVRMGHDQASGDLHPRCESKAACRERHAHARSGSHFRSRWELFAKSRMNSIGFSTGGAQGRNCGSEIDQCLAIAWITNFFHGFIRVFVASDPRLVHRLPAGFLPAGLSPGQSQRFTGQARILQRQAVGSP
jgi:hypothetical protein